MITRAATEVLRNSGQPPVQIGGYSRVRAGQCQSRNVTGFFCAAALDRPARERVTIGAGRVCAAFRVSCAFGFAGAVWLSRVSFRCGA